MDKHTTTRAIVACALLVALLVALLAGKLSDAALFAAAIAIWWHHS